MSLELPLFILIAFFMVVTASIVTFSRNLMYSAFALLGTLFGSAVLFGLLSSDFVAATQLLIYVGGILILILFAVMLTADIGSVRVTNRSIHFRLALPLIVALFIFMAVVLGGVDWVAPGTRSYQSAVRPIGHALLKEFLLPFEVVSLLLLGALVGAVVIVRREVR